MNTNEIHKIFSEEFMGHKVDGMIIQPPEPEFVPTEGYLAWEKFNREHALEQLDIEAKFVWDVIKDDK